MREPRFRPLTHLIPLIGRRLAGLGLVLGFAFAASRPAAGQERLARRVVEQIEALIAEKAARTPAERRVDSQLLLELERRRGSTLARAVPELVTGVATGPDGSTRVDIRGRVTPALLARIRALGGTVESRYPQYRAIRARVPLNRIEELAQSSEIDFIRPVIPPIINKENTSEGDVAHRADAARPTFGVDGTGISICALSDSVDHLASVQASGDLPAVTVLPGQSGEPGSGEGTAMLEIIHDLAPGADLFFATAFGGEAGFAANIIALRDAGCDVLVDDVFYLTEPTFQDGIIAQAVDTVVADGALYFSSAGNAGNLNDGTSGVWEGDFVPASGAPSPLAGSEAHDFGGGVNANTITVDSPFWFTLHWADPQAGSANDYDLYLLDPSKTVVWAASTNVQNGNDDPFESISSNAFDDTGGHLVIVRNPGAAIRYLHLNTHRGRLSVATAGQINGHSAARDAFAVAAVDAADAGGGAFTGGAANPVERFSSDGPRRVFFEADGSAITPGDFLASGGELRLKPDVTAADGVATATPGFSRFFGTSAAAPHAAAIAGLLLEADPTLTPDSLRSLLESTALDIEAPGFDRDSGFGIFDAFDALDALSGSSADVAVTMSDTVDPVSAGDTVRYAISVANGGPDAAENVIVDHVLATGSTFVSASSSQGGCSFSGGVVTCGLGDVASGATADISVTVGTSSPGTLFSSVSVSADTLDPDLADNSASESTTVAAPGLALVVDVVDTGSYGNNFGTDEHETSLFATFTGDGASTYYLQVTGYDVDFDDEVSVHVNGVLVGHLRRGPNNGLNAGDLFTLAPPLVTAGTNTIEFRERVAGWTWGVTDIGVLSSLPSGGPPVVSLTVDVVDSGAYGNNFGTNEHETLLAATFSGDGTTTYYLQVTGYDIDFDDEVAVHVNGTPIANLSTGPNNALNAGDVFTLPPALTVAGVNTVEFRERVAGWTWGVTDMGVLTTPPGGGGGTDITLTVDVVDPGEYGNNFGTDAHETVLSAAFTADGASAYYLQVVGYDIDFGDEVAVHLNGAFVGYLSEGPNNALNDGDVFVLEPALVPAGENVIEFRERVAGWTWGVTSIGVMSSPPGGLGPPIVALAVDVVDAGAYGNGFGTDEHPTKLIATFTGDGTTTYYLQVTGYDVDFGDEVSVHVNGTPIGHLSAGPNEALNSGDVFTLTPAVTVAGENTIEFRERVSGWIWGVTGIGVLTSPP